MIKRQYLILSILCLLPVLLFSFYSRFFSINTDVLTSLNRDYFATGFSTAFEQYENSLSRDLVIALKGEGLNELGLEADHITAFLDSKDEFEKSDASRSDFKNLGQFYFENHMAILTPKQRGLFKNKQFKTLEASALKKIYSPFSSALSTLTLDPYALVPGFFENFAKPVSLTPHNQYFKNNDLKPTLIIRRKITAGLEESALKILANLKLKNQNIKYYYSSLGLYGVVARSQAMDESSTFSLLTIVLILITFFFYFKSLRHLVLCLVSIVFCTSIGLYISSFVFGEIHLMSLLMGISILGIMADYFIHYFIKEKEEVTISGHDAFLSIKKPLLWSFITSLIGFIIFALAPLPLLQEFGVFSISSLFCAILVVRFGLVSFFKPTKPKSNKGNQLGLNERFIKALVKKNIRIWMIVPIFICFLFLLVLKNTNNDIRSFSTPDKILRQNESFIKNSIGYKYGYEFYIIRASNLEETLELEEVLKGKLTKASVRASFLTHYLPSQKTQKESISLYQSASENMDAFIKKFKMEAVDKTSGHKSFTLDHLKGKNPNLDIYKQNLGKIGEFHYIIVPLYISQESTAAKQFDPRIFEDKNIVYMNKLEFINKDVSSFSLSISYGIIIFSFIFFIILGFRFGVINAGAIILPSMISIIIAISSILVLGVGINIFHLLGTVLIFALGLDYSFFYFFNRKGSILTRSSIELSTLTTISSFGVLALSSTHAVSSFGTVVFIGIVSCWLWAPFSYLGAKNE